MGYVSEILSFFCLHEAEKGCQGKCNSHFTLEDFRKQMAGAIERSKSRNSRDSVRRSGLHYPAQLGARLRQLRKQRGLTQRSLAERLGVSTPALCRWETGQTLPRKTNIQAFADAFDLSEADLLSPVGVTADTPAGPLLTDRRTAQRAGERGPAITRDSLSDLLLTCKRQIAEATGTTPERIRIVIEV